MTRLSPIDETPAVDLSESLLLLLLRAGPNGCAEACLWAARSGDDLSAASRWVGCVALMTRFILERRLAGVFGFAGLDVVGVGWGCGMCFVRGSGGVDFGQIAFILPRSRGGLPCLKDSPASSCV